MGMREGTVAKQTGCLQVAIQASLPPLVVHFASGRLAARLTPYVLLLLLQRKHGLKVMVDRELLESVTHYFNLSAEAILPTLEEHFCPSSLQLVKQHMVPFTGSGEELESTMLSLGQGKFLKSVEVMELGSGTRYSLDQSSSRMQRISSPA